MILYNILSQQLLGRAWHMANNKKQEIVWISRMESHLSSPQRNFPDWTNTTDETYSLDVCFGPHCRCGDKDDEWKASRMNWRSNGNTLYLEILYYTQKKWLVYDWFPHIPGATFSMVNCQHLLPWTTLAQVDFHRPLITDILYSTMNFQLKLNNKKKKKKSKQPPKNVFGGMDDDDTEQVPTKRSEDTRSSVNRAIQ